MVQRRTEAALSTERAGRHAVHPVAERFQQHREQSVEFVTEAASPPDHDLGVERGRVQGHVLVEVDAEVLEGNGMQVRAVQLTQRLRVGLERSGIADPLKVGGYLVRKQSVRSGRHLSFIADSAGKRMVPES